MSQVTNDRFTLYNGDSVEICAQMPDNSVHFEIFSPPFCNTYIYSDDLRDMGNCKNQAEFFRNMDFLTPNLYRILKPGRLMAVHCKQMPRYATRDGRSGWYDFRGDLIRHYESHGFQYHSEVVIWTDPVLEMQKTKTQRLLYCQLRRDASKTGIGMPEYLLLFRKWEADTDETEPIRHFRDAAEAVAAGGDELQVMDLDIWQRYASPVWFDIQRTDVLNVRMAREDRDEKHLCPLQLDVIQRATELWTNPGEIVFTPFLGIGSEAYVALKLKRRAVGIELKEAYWNLAVKNCLSLIETEQISLFDGATR